MYPDGHEAAIVLDYLAQTGKGCHIGADGRGMASFIEDDDMLPARDSHLHILGENVEVWSNFLSGETMTVCDETVDPDE